jgi:hypothetical protein
MIPGFKAVVNKKGKTPTVVISKFFAGTTNNAMQFDLNYWYDEDRDVSDKKSTVIIGNLLGNTN